MWRANSGKVGRLCWLLAAGFWGELLPPTCGALLLLLGLGEQTPPAPPPSARPPTTMLASSSDGLVPPIRAVFDSLFADPHLLSPPSAVVGLGLLSSDGLHGGFTRCRHAFRRARFFSISSVFVAPLAFPPL